MNRSVHWLRSISSVVKSTWLTVSSSWVLPRFNAKCKIYVMSAIRDEKKYAVEGTTVLKAKHIVWQQIQIWGTSIPQGAIVSIDFYHQFFENKVVYKITRQTTEKTDLVFWQDIVTRHRPILTQVMVSVIPISLVSKPKDFQLIPTEILCT